MCNKCILVFSDTPILEILHAFIIFIIIWLLTLHLINVNLVVWSTAELDNAPPPHTVYYTHYLYDCIISVGICAEKLIVFLIGKFYVMIFNWLLSYQFQTFHELSEKTEVWKCVKDTHPNIYSRSPSFMSFISVKPSSVHIIKS